MKSISGAKTFLLFAVAFFGIHSNAIGAHWNATYYNAVPVWNSDYASGTVIWSSVGTGVDDPVWKNKSGDNNATFSVSSSNMMTHMHQSTYNLGSPTSELLYGWTVQTILELQGLSPGEYAQVNIFGLFGAETKTKIYVGLCSHWSDDAQAWVQVGGNLIAKVENIYVDQWADYLATEIDGDCYGCPYPVDHVENNGQTSKTFDLFGGNSFTAGNGFKVELLSNFYISSFIDPGRWTYAHPSPLSQAEGIGDQFSWEVTATMDAPVPIPSAVWLLGSGLLGILGFRKRFKKN